MPNKLLNQTFLTFDSPHTQLPWPNTKDLYIFIIVVRHGSFSKAAREMRVSISQVSKRIRYLEKSLKVQLFIRNNKSITLTKDGEKVLVEAVDVINQMNRFVTQISDLKSQLAGEICISSSFGFGQQFINPAISEFMSIYPDICIKFMLNDTRIDLAKQGVDIEIYVGNDIKEFYITKQLAPNRRILCASPSYLAQYTSPNSINELISHQCLVIQERNQAIGNWLLTNGTEQINIPLSYQYTTNSGNIALDWTLQDKGILLRSQWHVQSYLETGELVQILPDWYQPADIWAVFIQRPSNSIKITLLVNYLTEYLEKHLNKFSGGASKNMLALNEPAINVKEG